MKKEELAILLNGRVRGNELSKDEATSAKEHGLVVVFGASDDLMEFEGAIYGEADCYNGGEILFTKTGDIPTDEQLEQISELEQDLKIKIELPLNKIEAVWGNDVATWTYKTDIPHATFEIKEDADSDEPYCIGLVFEVKDLV